MFLYDRFVSYVPVVIKTYRQQQMDYNVEIIKNHFMIYAYLYGNMTFIYNYHISL